MKPYLGICGLLGSRKGTLSLLMLSAMTALALLGKLDGMAFAAGCSTITAIFCYTHARTDQLYNRGPNDQA